MKTQFLLAFLLGVLSVQALPHEQIFPKTKVIHSVDWYADQKLSWKDETGRRPADPSAWVNYYSAARYSQTSNNELNEIVSAMSKAVPESVELLLVKGWQAGFSSEALEYLNDAQLRRPNDPSAHASLLLLNEFFHHSSERAEYSQRLLQSGLISESLLNYSYNLLVSLEQDALLIIEGDNTTLPIYVLQDVMKVRTDVIVLNIDMLIHSDHLRETLNRNHLVLNLESVSGSDERKKSLCLELPRQNPGRHFYYALTLPKENTIPIRDQLYVVGLASVCSTQRMDNISVIRENLENRFLLDYLSVDFNGESESAAGKVMSANYLVPMLLLNDYYKKSGSLDKSKALEQLVLKLADESGKTGLINNLLNRPDDRAPEYALYPLKVKVVEDFMKKIRGDLYAGRTEVTNSDYNEFLKSLSQSNLPELKKKYSYDLSSYTEPATSFMKMYHADVTRKNTNNFLSFPAVNISHEAAIAYCDWLTYQYNNSPKRSYKKVKFRLPSVNEWQIAALGEPNFTSWNLDENKVTVAVPEDTIMEISKTKNKIEISVKDQVWYPWWGAYNYRKRAQNSRNCWLGNFKVPENSPLCPSGAPSGDGFQMMGAVASYFPNRMGLFDVVGNVAEMTDEQGKACGGSWNHYPDESTIHSINSYSGPDAAVGFRVFMEIVER